MTKEEYKHLYEPEHIECPACKGKGKVYRPDITAIDNTCRDLYRMDKGFRDQASARDEGNGWHRCYRCEGKGTLFDPVGTWGQEGVEDDGPDDKEIQM